jgi:hypothetical protein
MNTVFTAGRRAGEIARQVARADAAAWGQALEATTRTIAALAVVAYVAGEAVGRWVHETSAVLGQLHACLLVGHQKAAAVVQAAAAQIELASLNVTELRRVARERLGSAARLEGRRIAQARRAALLAALA